MPRRKEMREENFEDRSAHRRKEGEACTTQKKECRSVRLPEDFF
jgi:hypothetical protein